LFFSDTALAEVEKLTAQLNVKEADDGSRNATIQSLEQKCCRLREYIKKLTGKCSEWESSYDRQTKAIERLQDKNRRIATRYKELLEQKREQRRAHQQYRAKWSEERSNLHTVHINLERELEEIARELALPIDGHAAASN
jgi:predicted  nucleic acid-binding Zn-ribbon protein